MPEHVKTHFLKEWRSNSYFVSVPSFLLDASVSTRCRSAGDNKLTFRKKDSGTRLLSHPCPQVGPGSLCRLPADSIRSTCPTSPPLAAKLLHGRSSSYTHFMQSAKFDLLGLILLVAPLLSEIWYIDTSSVMVN